MNSKALKIRNLEKGITIQDWAKCLELTTPTAYAKLNGKSALSLEQANKIQKLLEIDDHDFAYYFLDKEED